MKNFPTVNTAIRNNTSVIGEKPVCTIEWNMNRYHTPVVDNPATTPAIDKAWNENGAGNMLPLKSIADLDKYGSGIAYVINDPAAKDFYKFYSYARMTEASRQSNASRFYYIGPDSRYKYWAAPVISSGTISSGSYPLSNVTPTITYPSALNANKISIKFNTHVTKPVKWTVQISADGTTFTTVATDVVVPSSGVVDLWAPVHSGYWSTSPNYYYVDGTNNNLKTVKAVRVNVTSLSRGSCRLELLEIAAKIEAYAGSYLDTFNVENTLSENDEIAPVGVISANTGSVNMANYTGFFNKKALTSPISPYLEEHALIRLYVDYNNVTGGKNNLLPNTQAKFGLDTSTTNPYFAATVVADPTVNRSGNASYKVTTDSIVNPQGLMHFIPDKQFFTAATPVVLSAWIKGPVGYKIGIGPRIYDTSNGYLTEASPGALDYVMDGTWQRISYAYSGYTGVNHRMGLQVVLRTAGGLPPAGSSFWVTDMQMDPGTTLNDYSPRLNESAGLVPLGTMLSDSWDVNADENCTVSLVDYARVLQEASCADVLLKKYHAAQIVWALCDSVGFKDVRVFESVAGESPVIDHFWCSKDDKVWEVLTKLAKDCQMAMVFGEDGVLNVYTKEYLYNTRAANWTARHHANGAEKPDIISLNNKPAQGSNKVSVNYRATNDFNISGSTNQIFWQAPDDYGIGACELNADLLIGDQYAVIRSTSSDQMPRFKSRIIVDGEHLEYTAKEYKVGSTLYLCDDATDYWAAVEANNGRPPLFTGRLKLKKAPVKNHRSAKYKLLNEFKVRNHIDGNLAASANCPQNIWLDGAGGVLLNNPSLTNRKNNRVTAFKNTGGSFNRVGMKFKIESKPYGSVGLMLFPQGAKDHKGYVFQVTEIGDPSVSGDATVRGETKAYRIENDGTPTAMKVAAPKTTVQEEQTDFFEKHHTNVKYNTWHYMEVIRMTTKDDKSAFAVYIDNRCVKVFLEPAGSVVARNNWAGFFVTGGSKMRVDKFYSIDFPSGKEYKKLPAETKLFYPDNDYILEMTDAADAKAAHKSLLDYRFGLYLAAFNQTKSIDIEVDDFTGNNYPFARELLTESYRYTAVPALHSKIYMSNPNVGLYFFNPGPMGANVRIVNTTNQYQFLSKPEGEFANVPRSGEKSAFYIWGKTVFQAEPQKIEKKDDASIRRRGEQELSFDATWIQTADAANKLAEWIFNNFGKQKDRYEIELFGNPLLQLSDSLAIVHDAADPGTFVLNRISNTWNAGLETKVTAVRTS